MYRGTLLQHLHSKLFIGRILLSVPDILHINPGSLFTCPSACAMTDMSTEDMKASVAQVWRATYGRERFVYPRQLSQSFLKRLVIIGELAFVLLYAVSSSRYKQENT